MSITKQRVLLIDHSGTSLAIINKLIARHLPGVLVDSAMNADEAFRLLKDHQYGLITTSRNLPDIECQQLVNTIRHELKVTSTPLIVISGEKMGVFEEQMACNLVNGYFDKKLGQQKLVNYISSFIKIEPPSARITGNILYVEDSATVALATKNLLSKYDYNYLHASDAETALQHIQNAFSKDHIQPFDLVLTDLQLEGHMSGRDLIREIRHGLGLSHEQLPVLVSTADDFHDQPDRLNRIITAGANDIIEKPVHEAILVARLNNLLALRQQYLQLYHPSNSAAVNQ